MEILPCGPQITKTNDPTNRGNNETNYQNHTSPTSQLNPTEANQPKPTIFRSCQRYWEGPPRTVRHSDGTYCSRSFTNTTWKMDPWTRRFIFESKLYHVYCIYTLFLSVGCVSHDTRWQPNKTESFQFGVESLGASFVA